MSDEEVGKNEKVGKGEEAGKQVECGCAGSDCCGPGAVPRSGVKTLIFVLVLLAAGAVLAHGIVGKKKKDMDEGSTAIVQADAFAALPVAEAVPADDGTTLPIVSSLRQVAVGGEVAFIVLPGEDEQNTRDVEQAVKAAVDKILSQKKKVAGYTLERESGDYRTFAAIMSGVSFPCVSAVGPNRGPVIVSGEVTEARLLQAFVSASMPDASCGPAGCGTPVCD